MKDKVYKVGIYCRLSIDDASNPAKGRGTSYIPVDESTSIENQREMLSKFVMLNGWVETKIYVDDGWSGGNFQRPGFQEMLEDARNGVINLILVKDLSRLGRDFVEVGRYTDVVFPSLGCRFVAVLDFLDSESDNTDMLHFRSLMNDYHLRDLSNKIRTVFHSKMLSGQYVGSRSPYGYRKSAEDKHKLVIDEYAAGVVRRIFDMRMSGMTYNKITAVLNQEGIPSPRLYWYQVNGKDPGKTEQRWLFVTVKGILNNELYNGTLRMNYSGTRSYKDHTGIIKPQSEWIYHTGLHEAIVSPEVWQAVQEINEATRKKYSVRAEPMQKLFSGKLICSDCKFPLMSVVETRHRKNGSWKRYISYRCSLYNRSGQTICSRHSIYEMTLSQIVLAEIQTHAQAVKIDETAVIEKLKREIAQCDTQRLAGTRQEIKQLQRRIEYLENMTAKLYEDKISGTISESVFVTLMQKNEQELSDKTERLNMLLVEVKQAEAQTAAIRNWAALIRKYSDLRELDRAIVEELIDHIEIGKNSIVDGERRQDIKIFYRFVGCI